MNDEEHSLLRACLVEGADDLPRMIYADWLEENGQPEQAEFVRLQLRLSGLPWWHEDRPRLAGRAAELMARERREWQGRAGLRSPRVKRLDFAQGIGRGELIAGPDDLDPAKNPWPDDALVNPLIDGLTVLRGVSAAPPRWPERLTRLRYFADGSDVPRVPLDHPALAEVRDFELGEIEAVTGPLARAVAAAPWFPRLRRLTCADRDWWYDIAPARVLFAGRRFPQLRALVINPLAGSAGSVLPALAASDMPALRSLAVVTREAQAGGLADLAAWPCLAHVRELTLRLIPRRGDGGAFTRSPHLDGLERLTVQCDHDRNVTDDLIELLGDRAWPGLRELTIDAYYGSAARVVRRRVTAERFPSLRCLDLGKLGSGEFEWGDAEEGDAVADLAEADLPPTIEAVTLPPTEFGPQTADALAASEWLGRLRYLGVPLRGRLSEPALNLLRLGRPASLRRLRVDNLTFCGPVRSAEVRRRLADHFGDVVDFSRREDS